MSSNDDCGGADQLVIDNDSGADEQLDDDDGTNEQLDDDDGGTDQLCIDDDCCTDEQLFLSFQLLSLSL